MSCGYLYEIRRKSQDFEPDFVENKRENSNLSDYSKDEEIWEVPEESFENVYQQMVCNEELKGENEQQDNINTITDVFNLKQFENTKTLHISLSTEQIALKSLNKQTSRNTSKSINKSINTETDVTKSMTSDSNITTTTTNTGVNKVQWKNCKLSNNKKTNSSSTSLLNFTIVPINVSSQTEKQKTTEQEEIKTVEKFPEIKLTSFSTRKKSLKPISSKTSTLKSDSGFYMHDLKCSSNLPRKISSSGFEINRHITESSTSPESLLDNILSGASSVSVQSSSISSSGLNGDFEGPTFKQESKNLSHSLALSQNNIVRNSSDIMKTQISELKVITAPNSPTKQQQINVRTHASPSILTIGNLSHSDSFETASNRTR